MTVTPKAFLINSCLKLPTVTENQMQTAWQ